MHTPRFKLNIWKFLITNKAIHRAQSVKFADGGAVCFEKP